MQEDIGLMTRFIKDMRAHASVYSTVPDMAARPAKPHLPIVNAVQAHLRTIVTDAHACAPSSAWSAPVNNRSRAWRTQTSEDPVSTLVSLSHNSMASSADTLSRQRRAGQACVGQE